MTLGVSEILITCFCICIKYAFFACHYRFSKVTQYINDLLSLHVAHCTGTAEGRGTPSQDHEALIKFQPIPELFVMFISQSRENCGCLASNHSSV